MPVYIIVEVDIHDNLAYEDYKKLTPASIAAYKGTFVVRGGDVECLEGDGNPGELWSWNFHQKNWLNNGGRRLSILLQKGFASNLRKRK
jgi:uncharacterized protein (DUF1330 family)